MRKYDGLFDMSGKAALVAGGTGAIGSEMAGVLAAYGARVQRIPLGRVCETIDLAGIALFFASDASAFITGQNVFVDGGVTATQ